MVDLGGYEDCEIEEGEDVDDDGHAWVRGPAYGRELRCGGSTVRPSIRSDCAAPQMSAC